MMKKLYRDTQNKKLCGVCAGLGKYFSLDVTLIRLIWAIAVLCAGCGILAYILCALIIPEDPGNVIDAGE